jgi:hypothetical protein
VPTLTIGVPGAAASMGAFEALDVIPPPSAPPPPAPVPLPLLAPSVGLYKLRGCTSRMQFTSSLKAPGYV